MFKQLIIMNKVLLVGASGLVGSHLLKYILKEDSVQQLVLLNRRNVDVKHPKLVQHEVDFENLSDELFQGVDALFCCIGTTLKKAGSKHEQWKVDYDIPVYLAQLAKKNDVESFSIISSLGAKATSKNFYLKMKGQVEKVIQQLNIPSVNIFRPSLLLGDRTESRPGEDIAKVFMPIMRPILNGKWRKYRPIYAEVVAKSMFRIANERKLGTTIIESDKIEETGSEY